MKQLWTIDLSTNRGIKNYTNSQYQPTFAYLPEKDVIVEYDAMFDSKEGGEEFLKDSCYTWEFIGYGFQVYTYTKTDWENPDLAVGQFVGENKALFVRVN
jgi:hypothetical protein